MHNSNVINNLIRVGALLIWVSVLTVACTLPTAHSYSPVPTGQGHSTTPTITCTTHEGSVPNGSSYEDGKWTTSEGEHFGWSAEEDSTIYRCSVPKVVNA